MLNKGTNTWALKVRQMKGTCKDSNLLQNWKEIATGMNGKPKYINYKRLIIGSN